MLVRSAQYVPNMHIAEYTCSKNTAEGFTSCKLESSCEVHMYLTYTGPSFTPVIITEKYFQN